MKTPAILDIAIDEKAWRSVKTLSRTLEKAAALTLDHLPEQLRYPCSINLLLTNDDAMGALNRDFRGRKKPTNVLSFPQFEPRHLPKRVKAKAPVYIGDIAMGYQYIVDETERYHKILLNHITHLLIHGILHLFGYHHASDRGAARMEGLEKKIMAELKLPDPYAAPPPAARKK